MRKIFLFFLLLICSIANSGQILKEVNFDSGVNYDNCGVATAKYIFYSDNKFELFWFCPNNNKPDIYTGTWKTLSSNSNQLNYISTVYMYDGVEYEDILTIKDNIIGISWNGGEEVNYKLIVKDNSNENQNNTTENNKSLSELSGNYIKFNYLADGILDFNTLFEGGNDYNFYTCAGGSCGGSLISQFNEQIQYLKFLSNQNKITVETYEKYKSISKDRTEIINDFIDILNLDKLENIENNLTANCEEFKYLFGNESNDCSQIEQEALNVSNNFEKIFNDFSLVAHKDELSVNNNNSLNDNLSKIKNLLMNYENKIQEIDSKVVKLNIDEKNKLEEERLEKERQNEEKRYYAELNSNFANKTKLFGVQLTDNPKKYNLLKKNTLKKDFAGGIYYENTTYDYYLRNYNIEVKDIIYSIEPPIINNSFYDYQIISREFGGIKIITDIIAKAKLINKGLDGCSEFLDPIESALYKKYGFQLNDHFNVMTPEKQIIDVVLISDCLVGDTFSIDPYDQLFNADTLHLRLRANITEEQFLKLFDVGPDQKNKVDTNNF